MATDWAVAPSSQEQADKLKDDWAASPWANLLTVAEYVPKEDVTRLKLMFLEDERQTRTFVELMREWYRRLAMVSVFVATGEVHTDVQGFQRIRLFRKASSERDIHGVAWQSPTNRLMIPFSYKESPLWGHMLDEHGEDVHKVRDIVYGKSRDLYPGVVSWRGSDSDSLIPHYVDLALELLSLAWDTATDDVGWVNGIEGKVPSTLPNPYEPLRDLLAHPFKVSSLLLYYTQHESVPIGWKEVGVSFGHGRVESA